MLLSKYDPHIKFETNFYNSKLNRYVKKFLGAPTDIDQENLKIEYEKLLEE